MIEAVFFDIDDTLVDFDTAAHAAFRTLFGETADYPAWMALSRQWYPRHPAELSWEAMRVGRTSAFLESIGRNDDAHEAEAHRMRLIEASYEVFPDVADCLNTLRDAGLKLGVITNSQREHQLRKLSAVGLGGAFDVVVVSGEVGVSKPDRAIFEYACGAIGSSAAACVHVGDRLDLDALGAHDAGMRGVWLDRRAEANGEVRVRVISSLAQLPELVAGG